MPLPDKLFSKDPTVALSELNIVHGRGATLKKDPNTGKRTSSRPRLPSGSAKSSGRMSRKRKRRPRAKSGEGHSSVNPIALV